MMPRRTLVKKKKYIVLLVCFSYLYFQYGNSFLSWHCTSFSLHEYPLDNVLDIVESIQATGNTTANPINNDLDYYSIIYNIHCSDQVDLVIMVKSYVGNFLQRMAIRSTWGKSANSRVKVCFVTGYSKLRKEILRLEYLKYKDIIQFSFLDTYRNNIYKTMMSYKWIVKHCSSSRFVFFSDDDFYVNIQNILQFSYRSITNNTMYGHEQCYKQPVRNQTSKWYISEEQYPFDMFPTFLSGGAILTHISVVRRFQIAFPYIKIIDLDDVYVAIVAHKLSITLLNNKRFAIEEKKRTDVDNIMSSHEYKMPADLFQAWENYSRGNVI
jgi:hypothetical protein